MNITQKKLEKSKGNLKLFLNNHNLQKLYQKGSLKAFMPDFHENMKQLMLGHMSHFLNYHHLQSLNLVEIKHTLLYNIFVQMISRMKKVQLHILKCLIQKGELKLI